MERKWYDVVLDAGFDFIDFLHGADVCLRWNPPRRVRGKTFHLPNQGADWTSHRDGATGRTVTLFIEGPHRGDPDLIVSTRSLLGWDSPHEREALSTTDRERIFAEIVAGYKAKGFYVFVEDYRFTWMGDFEPIIILDVVSGRVLKLKKLSGRIYRPEGPPLRFRLPKCWSAPKPNVPIDTETLRELSAYLRDCGWTVEG